MFLEARGGGVEDDAANNALALTFGAAVTSTQRLDLFLTGSNNTGETVGST